MPQVFYSHVQSAIFLVWCRIGKYSCSYFFLNLLCYYLHLLPMFSTFDIFIVCRSVIFKLFYFPSQEWFHVNYSSSSKWPPTFISGRLLMIFSILVNVVIEWKFVSTVFLFIPYKSHLTVRTILFLSPLMYAMLGR